VRDAHEKTAPSEGSGRVAESKSKKRVRDSERVREHARERGGGEKERGREKKSE